MSKAPGTDIREEDSALKVLLQTSSHAATQYSPILLRLIVEINKFHQM